MKTMQTIVLIACVISLISGILDAVRPNRKFDRQMQLLLSVVFLLAILIPLAKGAGNLRTDIWTTDHTEVAKDLTVAAQEQTQACAAQNLEQNLTAYLCTNGVVPDSVQVSMHTGEDGSIEIECVTVKCTDPETARTCLTAYLGEEVTLYVG